MTDEEKDYVANKLGEILSDLFSRKYNADIVIEYTRKSDKEKPKQTRINAAGE